MLMEQNILNTSALEHSSIKVPGFNFQVKNKWGWDKRVSNNLKRLLFCDPWQNQVEFFAG